MALSEEVVDEYKTSLADLNFNSKPLINMLTMLAEDHEQHAPEIVKVIEDHIHKCVRQKKLPALYLMDSIMKNLEKSSYRSLFSRNLVQTFTSVFEQVDEKTRASMFKLRQTWTSILPNAVLYRIDKKIKSLLDPAWPITATEPEQTSIHVNPRFLQGMGSESERSSPEVTEEPAEDSEDQEMLIRQQLIEKQQELLRLKQARLELELAETAEKLKRKPGAKGQSTKATPLGLPLPSVEEVLPLPEVVAKPRDPRPRPTDPRRRDPRLQSQVVSSQSAVSSSVTGLEPVAASIPGYSTFSDKSSVSVIPGSSHSTFPPVPHGPHSVSQVGPIGAMQYTDSEQGFGVVRPYNGLPSHRMPYHQVGAIPPDTLGHVFSGEVFIPDDCAKFSDENDSDSSRSSAQGQRKSALPSQTNIRDPRHRIEHKRSHKDPRTEQKSGHHERPRNGDKPQGRHASEKMVQRHSGEKHVTETKDSHRDTKDPRPSGSKETQEKRKSKDREMHVSSKQIKEHASASPRKSASGQQASKGRSLSKDRDSKSDTRLKETLEAERRKKEEESKRSEFRSDRKSEEKRPEKTKERTSRERERSPSQLAKQYSNKSKDGRGAGDRKVEKKYEERKEMKSEPKKSDSATNRKGNDKLSEKKADKNKASQKETTSKFKTEPMDIDDRVKPAKEAEKRLSSDREIYGRIAKKPKLEKPLEEAVTDTERVSSQKGNKGSETGRKSGAIERVKTHEDQDVNIKEEDMDIDSESETVAEPSIPKIETDISDLFGGEDEDYRPAVPKHQLPLKSPRSKGWDQFKASQPDQYAYDIELKKQRQDSVVESSAIKSEEMPQDEDLRVHQPDFQQQIPGTDVINAGIPEELSMNQHAEILLKAHKQLKDGLITHEQHQELLKQLGALMHIQQLQEENRRLSSEAGQPQEMQEHNRRLSNDVFQHQEQMSSSVPQPMSSPPQQPEQAGPITDPLRVREVISPERPIDSFKIPKKPARDKTDEEERRKELSNLYPESPQEDRYKAHGPFLGRDNQNRLESDIPPIKQETDERENQEGWGAPIIDRREGDRSAYRHGQEIPVSPHERFDRPPEQRSPRSRDFGRSPPRENVMETYSDERVKRQDGPSANFDGRISGTDSRPRGFDGRGPGSHGPPDNYEDQIQEPSDFDSRRPRFDGPPNDFDRRRPRHDDQADEFDARRHYGTRNDFNGRQRHDGPPGDYDGRRPEFDGPPDGFDGRQRPDGPPGDFDSRRRQPDGPPGDFDNRRPRPDGPPGDFDNRRPRPDGLPDDFDGRRPGLDGNPADFDIRRQRPEGPPGDFDDNWARGPQDRFEPGPESRGPSRDRRPDGWPERRGPDVPDQGSEWNQVFDRRGRHEINRREMEGGQEFFHGPGRFPDDDRRGAGRSDWGDSRKSDRWRDQDDDNFEMEGPHDRNLDPRGPPGRFRKGRNIDQRGSDLPDDFPPDRRGGPRDHPGRNRGGRRGGPPGDRRPWRDDDGPPDNWDESRKPVVEGPFGRPGPPSEGSKPWLPPGQRGDSPVKEQWRGRPDQKLNRFGRKGDMHNEDEYEPAGVEKPKSKPLMSLLDPLPSRPPPGLRKILGDSHNEGPGARGPQGFDGPGPKGHPGMKRHSGPFQPNVDSYVDKFGDPRFRCFVDMGPEVSEEVVIGKRNFEIKLGAPPRKISWGKDFIEVFADPSKRGIVVDNTLMYKFGERVKDVTIRGRKEKLFYHGRPLNLWIDGQHYEVRVDAPPKSINIDNKTHKIQIDGRDMMILIDKEEKGKYGGEPRFVFIDEQRKEIRFEPPPRHIIIDGNPCELKLNLHHPCVNINGIYHGIRFDGPPRDVFINGKLYQIFTDHAVKIRVGNRYHYVALGGPCHEIIVDGKWFEMKFNEAPKEINVGNQVLMVRIPGNPPEVKILPEIGQEPRLIPPGMQGPVGPPGMMSGPGPMGFPGPRGPNMGPGMPIPGPGIPPMQQPGGPMPPQPGSLPGAPMNIPQSSTPNVPFSGAPMIPGIGQPGPGAPVTQQSGMPNVLSSLFSTMPATTSAPVPIDINSLFDKLVNTGIIKKEPEPAPATTKAEVTKPPEYIVPQKKAPKEEEKFADIPDMTEMDVTEMKSLPVGMVQRLYAGIQCTSCGERFLLKDGEKTAKYRQHLDWHFRQNRKEKTDMKLSSCRKWYYPISDWMQYEEVADTKETGKSNFFEQQQQQPVDTTPTKNPLTLVVPEGVSAIRCPAATGNDDEDMCNICHEVFEQYWDEELEEWHLRDAIRVNNKTYHPICFEDHTDVSEGTPSPSVLSVTEPGFVSRKSLAYDEASQDGHHASFEEERKISSSIAEPMDTTTASDSSSTAYNAVIKTEPSDNSEYGGTIRVKQEPVMEEMSHDQTDSVEKSETDSDKKPMETESFSVVVKQEPQEDQELPEVQKPPEILENIPESNVDTTSQPSVEIKTEPVERTTEEENISVPLKTDLVDKSSEQETTNSPLRTDAVEKMTIEENTDEQVAGSETDEGTAMKCSNSDVPDIAVTEKPEPETVSESASPDAQKPVKDTQNDTENKVETMEGETELVTEPKSPPKTSTEITTSGLHENTSSTHLAPPGEMEACESQHSPTYSKLSKISLVIPQQTADITPEVLEIGSNASTPTQDELPSPLGQDT